MFYTIFVISFSTILILAGIALLTKTLFAMLFHKDTQGKIVSSSIYHDHRGFPSTRLVTVEYLLEDGSTHRGKTIVPAFLRYKTGKRVHLYYDVNNPGKILIGGFAYTTLSILIIVFAVAIMIIYF